MPAEEIPSSTIRAKCSCGKIVAASAKLAGKRVRCPACKQPLLLPSPPSSSGSSEALRVRCRCGQTLAFAERMAGRAVRCPKCQQPLRIPTTKQATGGKDQAVPPETSPLGALLDEVGMKQSKTGKRCPECRADMAPDAILCIDCGYHLELGKKLTTQRPKGRS